MEIIVNLQDIKEVDKILDKEWVESDNCGNYASSTITGLNTRNNHGLLNIWDEKTKEHFVLLSHIQEDFYIHDKQYSLYSVEYGTKLLLEGLQNQKEFRLEPFPTFVYQCNNVQIRKSVILPQDHTRVIVHYKVITQTEESYRLVVRPFFAYRAVRAYSKPDKFINREVFSLNDNFFRFLPFPDAREIYMFCSEGQFIKASMWYHHFYYRKDKDSDEKKEDLLNPGFFEIPFKGNNEILLTAGLQEINYTKLLEYYKNEKEKRFISILNQKNKNRIVQYMFKRTSSFRSKYSPEFYLMGATIPCCHYNLSMHCFITRNLLRSGANKEIAGEYYYNLLNLIADVEISQILSAKETKFQVDPLTPFLLIFVLYEYHILFAQGKSIKKSLDIMQEIIERIAKNHTPWFKIKRSKFLEIQQSERSNEIGMDLGKFIPFRDDFLIQVFWYNALKMTSQLAQNHNHSAKKYGGTANKLSRNIIERYAALLVKKSPEKSEEIEFSFHPAMILALTLPFDILNKSDSSRLYLILVKNFMSASGIKIPVIKNGFIEHHVSPVFLGDFFDAWQNIMKEKRAFYMLFFKITKRINKNLQKGILGFLPDFLDSSGGTSFENLISGFATSEVLYFLTKVADLRKES